MARADNLDIWPPIRLVSMGAICLAGIVYLPNAWWGILIKVVLAIWLLSTVIGSFGNLWNEYETMGAFVTIQLAAIAAIMIFTDVLWVTILASFIIILGWMTMVSRTQGKFKKP